MYRKIAMMAVITVPSPVAALTLKVDNPYSPWTQVYGNLEQVSNYAPIEPGRFGGLPLAMNTMVQPSPHATGMKHVYKRIQVSRTFRHYRRHHGKVYVYRARKLVTRWIKTDHTYRTNLQVHTVSKQQAATRIAARTIDIVHRIAPIDDSNASYWNAERKNVSANEFFSFPVTTSTELPAQISADRTIYAQRLADKARRKGVPVALALAIGYQESRFNPRAKSNVGASGMMQVMPQTFKENNCKGNIWNADDNMDCGLDYLAQGLAESNGDIGYTARRYFGGPNVNLHGRKTAQYERDIRRHVQRFATTL